MRLLVFVVVTGVCIGACTTELYRVSARVETYPVYSPRDAADDPAVFVHPDDPLKSILIGTDKQRGLELYDLQGNFLRAYPIGRLNNVDLIKMPGNTLPLIGGSNRSDNSLGLYFFQPDSLSLLPALPPVPVQMTEVYGFCFMQTHQQRYAVVSGTEGEIEIFHIQAESETTVSATPWKAFQLPGQTEGLVFDQSGQALYLAEENGGIWRWYPAAPGQAPEKVVALEDFPRLKADLEGLAIYYSDDTRYLMVSSQGNHQYGIFELSDSLPRYRGNFRITGTPQIDPVRETDGIAIVSCPLDPFFPAGMVIVQDGNNKSGQGGRQHQNFKIIDWRDIARAFDPPLAEIPLCNY